MSVAACCWGVIAAAGSGLRMGASVPKQYLPLNGRPLMAHAIEAMLADPRVAMLVVVVQAGTPYWERIAAALPPGYSAKVMRADGGATRAASVLEGLKTLRERGGVSPTDWVLVHDAARPCLARSDLARLIDTVSSQADSSGGGSNGSASDSVTTCAGGVLAYPVADTIKRVADDGRVIATVPRDGLWRALTPQMFRLGELTEAMRRAVRGDRPYTDEAQAMECAGASAVVVRGGSDNIKVTTRADLELAAAILRRREKR